MPADANVVLSTSALAKSFGDTLALGAMTCAVARGEVVGLLGLLRPTSGSATILGHDCTKDALEVKRVIGYVPDEPAFYDFLSGRETLEFVLTVRGMAPSAVWPRALELARLVDFESQLDAMVGGYSHGMKKKLALLVALVHEPAVLLLDEPTNGLDPPTAARVRDLFRSLAARGTAILVSTHLLDMADRMCDRLLVLHHGHVIAEGTPASIRDRAEVAGGSSLEDAFLALVK